MEQKIELKSTHNLNDDDLKRMYLCMSMLQTEALRTPNYNEHVVLAQLLFNLVYMVSELDEQLEKEPNNETIKSMIEFFQLHIGNLKRIIPTVTEKE